MGKIKRILLTLCIPLVALTSCATYYQKEGVFQNGYSDYRVGENRFVVSFHANEFTPQEKVMEYVLKRASDLTVKNGWSYFSIIEQKDLYYPSVRIMIECYHQAPAARPSIYAPDFLALHRN
ncbi:MAG: hypothetical protein HY069_02115 [Chlamydiia bacterium]|nr:hypothetical protein [Chlamydiia bacterium]